MTRDEFETWIEQHYKQLGAVAKRRVRQDYEDVLQRAVLAMLSRPELAKRTPATIWPWAVEVVRESAKDARVSVQRQKALRGEAKKILPAALLQR